MLISFLLMYQICLLYTSLVPRILLPMYGWPHQEAGIKYPEREMSFRQTITATNYSSRGFKVNVDWQNQCVFISFNFFEIDDSHAQWRDYIRDGVGIGDIRPCLLYTSPFIKRVRNSSLVKWVCAEDVRG